MPDHKKIVHCRVRHTDQYSNVQMYKIKIYGSLLICYSREIYVGTLDMLDSLTTGLI